MSWKDFKVSDECLGVAYHAEEGSKYIISTPYKIACEMVELLPEELFVPETKFLNIFSKSGQILLAIKNRLMESEAMIKRFPDERRRQLHIVWHQLYGLCLTERCVDSTAFMLYDTAWNDYNNLVRCDNLISLVKEDQNKALEFIHKNFKEYNEYSFLGLKESEETEEIMKFDVVIGNPPYNNDMYIPFVELGHKLSEKCSVFITPAKWQAKGGKLNESFRKNIVPYMSKIVFFTDSREVFDIGEFGGISYYILDKNIHSTKMIKSVCKNSNIIGCNYEEHIEKEVCTYPISFIKIINKCKGVSLANNIQIKRFVYTAEQERGNKNKKSSKDVDIMQGEKLVGYLPVSEIYTTEKLDKYKIITPIIISGNTSVDKNGFFCRYFNTYYIKPNQVPKGSFPILRYFDTEDEAKSFCSYIYTKFFMFLFGIGVCGTTLTKEFFRFVPDPQDWSVTYEDKSLPNYIPDENGNYIDSNGNKHCSLYVKYKLTENDINIIESVIKERK